MYVNLLGTKTVTCGIPQPRWELLLTARPPPWQQPGAGAAAQPSGPRSPRRESSGMSLEQLFTVKLNASRFSDPSLDVILRQSNRLRMTKHGYVRLASLESADNSRRPAHGRRSSKTLVAPGNESHASCPPDRAVHLDREKKLCSCPLQPP